MRQMSRSPRNGICILEVVTVILENVNDWKKQFKELYDRTLARVRAGERRLDKLFTEVDREFLRSIGSKPIEMFDACEDFAGDGMPTFEETLQMHEIRRTHFLDVQGGKFPAAKTDYRARDARLGGILWLPRAIDKARAKLEGRLIDELYYPCGGDRRMLDDLGIGRVEFFQIVHDNPTDDAVLAEVLKRTRSGAAVTRS